MSKCFRLKSVLIALVAASTFTSMNASAQAYVNSDEAEHEVDTGSDDIPANSLVEMLGCATASKQNVLVINEGNRKLSRFLAGCAQATNNSPWCAQLVRPNPSSSATFSCTYGSSQPHTLVDPDESTWPNAYLGVKLVGEMLSQGIGVQQIYNWWRPEPYNKNVGGAGGRHPFGTSVDVRFNTMSDMERAHKQLCQWRAQGRIRAVGYYGSTGLHFGVGDKLGNTWGKSCPSNLAARE